MVALRAHADVPVRDLCVRQDPECIGNLIPSDLPDCAHTLSHICSDGDNEEAPRVECLWMK